MLSKIILFSPVLLNLLFSSWGNEKKALEELDYHLFIRYIATWPIYYENQNYFHCVEFLMGLNFSLYCFGQLQQVISNCFTRHIPESFSNVALKKLFSVHLVEVNVKLHLCHHYLTYFHPSIFNTLQLIIMYKSNLVFLTTLYPYFIMLMSKLTRIFEYCSGTYNQMSFQLYPHYQLYMMALKTVS